MLTVKNPDMGVFSSFVARATAESLNIVDPEGNYPLHIACLVRGILSC